MSSKNPNYYIPLYYSNLQYFVPEDEEILFSGFYKVIFEEKYSIATFKSNKIWYTHVLFTEKGFYYGEYRRKMQPRARFISWGLVEKLKKKSISIKRLDLIMRREPNFESRNAYKTRKKEFLEKIRPIMQEGIRLFSDDFKEQMKKIKKEENDSVQGVFDDKNREQFKKMMRFIRLQKRLSSEDKIGYGSIYKDIRKNKMKNKVHMFVLDLTCGVSALLFLVGFIPLSFLLGINEFTLVIVFGSLLLLILTVFHRFWLKKRNFALSEQAIFFKEDKSETGQHIFEEFNKLPKNLEGFQTIRLMTLGGKAYGNRDFDKCARIFQQILKINPDLDMNWYMLLESLSYLARWEEMVTIGEEAIKLHPNFGPNYLWLADAYTEIGKKDKALEIYTKGLHVLKEVLVKDPKDDNIINSIGYIYLKTEEYEEAIKCYKEAIRLRPKSEHHLHSLGQTYMKMDLYDDAIKYLEKSLEHNPKHSYAWFDLGLIYEDSNQLEKAIECFEKAVEFYPQWVKIREKLIKVKPNSSALFKKLPVVKEKTASDNLYETLHTQGREDQINKYESSLNRLLNMNETQLIPYLTSLIYSFERRIERFKKNRFVPPFVVERLNIQKKFKEKLLENLREYPNYVSKFRTIVENDIEFLRVRAQRQERSQEEFLESLFNLLLEMPYEQLVMYLKEEIVIKQEMLKYKPMDDKEIEMRNLALRYVKETLKNLEENRANIQGFRKEIKKGLDDLMNGNFSVFNEKLFHLF